MKRRTFLSTSALATLGAALRSAGVKGQEAPDPSETEIDPYFLDMGELTSQETQEIAGFERYLELQADGKPAVMPRGGRPRRAPTYRFLHWSGELGDPNGRFIGPLSVKPDLPEADAYVFNAQVLGFNISAKDWSGKADRGTLTIEIRGRLNDESVTWLFAQQFDIFANGSTNLGLEYIAQRDGIPDPVLTDRPNLDIRIQLMREVKKSGILGKILRVASSMVGLPIGGLGSSSAFLDALPAIRVPQMLREGVAFSQAFFGGLADEKPMWRSGFNSYSLGSVGSRMRLAPGYWMAIDESQAIDLKGAQLVDMGGWVGLSKNGQPVNANYLVIATEISEGEKLQSDEYEEDYGSEEYPEEEYQQEEEYDGGGEYPRGVIPKGEGSRVKPKN